MPRARLILHEKQIEEDGSIVEMKIWSVPASSLDSRGVKYRLVYVRGEKRVLGYDNAHGHDHRHYEGKSEPYRFKSIRALLGDFKRDLSKLRLQEDKQ